ncbi:MAG: hypothetical protein H0T74_02810 [Rubrobacteraceae bacterium]|nr:hypothetical protein [Rubrobacteraceae bacterium]
MRSASHGTCAKYNDFPILAGDPEAREHVGIGSVFIYTMVEGQRDLIKDRGG